MMKGEDVKMVQYFIDYLDILADLHTEIIKAVRQLPADALDWIPFADGNSLSVLIVHTAGAEKFWLGDVVANEPSGRDRPAEFRAKNAAVAELEAMLSESLGYAELVLAKLGLDDLAGVRRDPRNGQEVTVAWALNHVLEHTALHLGHIQVTRDFWSKKPENASE
jgi:uncharacterized damage-inducible protein DinB